MNVLEMLNPYLSENIKKIFNNTDNKIIDNAEEIRIRVNKPLCVKSMSKEYYFNTDGGQASFENAYLSSINDISKMLEMMSDYSLYAFGEEIKNGYITLPGGFRVGISGKAVTENGILKTIKNISGLNIRVSREVKGCGLKLVKYIALPDLKHTLIISPPNCGKTTLLRDIIRILSDGGVYNIKGRNIGLVDERSEIAGSYMGIPQNDVGIRTDILDSCPKAVGMIMMLRSMAPEIIAVDEIGNAEDINAVDSIINSGIRLICTVHGKTIEDIKSKPVLSDLIKKNIFECFIILSHKNGPGTIEAVLDKEFNLMEVV